MLVVDKKSKFTRLCENVAKCTLCERMKGRTKVLSEKNGSLDSRVVFVGEAPGRLGADQTKIPFYGDQAGKNFERLLNAAELNRSQIFITNAVLCNPRNGNGHNAPPTTQEMINCSLYLSLALDIVRPEIVVPMGHWALNALKVIEPHSIELTKDVGKPYRWHDYTVIPMYHPGPRAAVHRRVGEQLRDFLTLAEVLDEQKMDSRTWIKKQLPLLEIFEPTLVQRIVFNIIRELGTVSKFKLAKLLYLLDWQEVKQGNGTITGLYYLTQKNGPLPTGLTRALNEMEGHELSFHFVSKEPTYSLGEQIRTDMGLPSNIAGKVDRLVEQCGHLTDSQIKTKAYMTAPMKQLIRRQRSGENTLNHPTFDGWIPTRKDK